MCHIQGLGYRHWGPHSSSVCGLVLMGVMYKIEIDQYPPVSPPPPIKPTVIPTGRPPTLRLPDNVIPESYNVFIQPYLYPAITNNYTNQSFAFTGNSTVKVKCMRDSKSIFLHAQNLNVTTLEVRKSDSNEKLSLRDIKCITMKVISSRSNSRIKC